MTMMTIHIGDLMAAPEREQPLAQGIVGTIVTVERSANASAERPERERWMERIEEETRGRLEDLQRCVCELLIKNQQLRMALLAARELGQ